MGLLGVDRLGLELAGLCVLLAKLGLDVAKDLALGVFGQRDAVRAHVRDEADLIERLGELHGALGLEAVAVVGFLLQRRRRERRRRRLAHRLLREDGGPCIVLLDGVLGQVCHKSLDVAALSVLHGVPAIEIDPLGFYGLFGCQLKVGLQRPDRHTLVRFLSLAPGHEHLQGRGLDTSGAQGPG